MHDLCKFGYVENDISPCGTENNAIEQVVY